MPELSAQTINRQARRRLGSPSALSAAIADALREEHYRNPMVTPHPWRVRPYKGPRRAQALMNALARPV